MHDGYVDAFDAIALELRLGGLICRPHATDNEGEDATSPSRTPALPRSTVSQRPLSSRHCVGAGIHQLSRPQ